MKKTCSIELPPDDFDMNVNDDIVVEVAKRVGRGYHKCTTTIDEAQPTCFSSCRYCNPPLFHMQFTSSSYENKVTMLPLSSRVLHSQQVPKSNVSSGSPSGLGCSVLLDKNLIPTMMEIGANENPHILETFNFMNKVSTMTTLI